MADIEKNPKHLKIKELAVDQTAHALSDVDTAVVNNDYAVTAKLGDRQMIYQRYYGKTELTAWNLKLK